jgi:hypothetical protein
MKLVFSFYFSLIQWMKRERNRYKNEQMNKFNKRNIIPNALFFCTVVSYRLFINVYGSYIYTCKCVLYFIDLTNNALFVYITNTYLLLS